MNKERMPLHQFIKEKKIGDVRVLKMYGYTDEDIKEAYNTSLYEYLLRKFGHKK